MRAVVFAVALAVTAPLAACISTSPLHYTAHDERALYAAEAAYQGVLLGVNAAIDAGTITPGSERALELADGLDRAYSALLLTRQAYEAGNASTGYQMALEALSLAAQVQEALNDR